MDRLQVGAILHQTRDRRGVELSEVEAATKIRLRFLRAIEAEEWEVLPGGVYTRGFIRTYAAFLGLDGERLAEDYRSTVEGEPAIAAAPGPSLPPQPRPRRGRLRLGWITAIGAVALLAAAVLVFLPSGEGGGGTGTGTAKQRAGEHRPAAEAPADAAAPALPEGVSLLLVASAEVWVCLLDGRGEPLLDGQILEAGAEAGPFHSGSFTVSFGNGEVSMMVDGKEAEIPATPSPIGYSIDRGGSLIQLGEAERPSCT